MSKETKKPFVVYKSQEEIKETILLNFIKMLANRKILDPMKVDTYFEELTKKVPEDDVYQIVSEYDLKNKSNRFYTIKMFPVDVSTITKTVPIKEYIAKYKNAYRFVVVKKIMKSPYKDLTKIPDVEVFLEYELMLNIMEHHMVPKHEIVPENEDKKAIIDFMVREKLGSVEELSKTYDTSKLPDIKTSDPVARNLGAKVGQIVRITRPSNQSGWARAYRKVVPGAFPPTEGKPTKKPASGGGS